MPSHRPTGRTRSYYGGQELPPPAELWIVQYPDDAGFYLFYLDAEGKEQTDTYHDSLDQAMEQARFEFGIDPEEWEMDQDSGDIQSST